MIRRLEFSISKLETFVLLFASNLKSSGILNRYNVEQCNEMPEEEETMPGRYKKGDINYGPLINIFRFELLLLYSDRLRDGHLIGEMSPGTCVQDFAPSVAPQRHCES